MNEYLQLIVQRLNGRTLTISEGAYGNACLLIKNKETNSYQEIVISKYELDYAAVDLLIYFLDNMEA